MVAYHQRGNKAVIKHIKNNLEELIEQQEKNVGITQFGNPKIIFGKANVRPNLYGRDNFENNLAGFLKSVGNFFSRRSSPLGDADQTFFHEMGHYYADKLSESYG